MVYATDDQIGIHFNPQEWNKTREPQFFCICYPVLAEFLGSADAACVLQRIHYWLQNKKAGYRLKDGMKWILNGYREWAEQLTWLSPQQIGRYVRRLEELGWLICDRFYNLKREVGFASRPPILQEDNQRKWYRIDYVQIFNDTGFDLLFDQEDLSAPPKTAEILENSQCSNLNIAMFKFEQSSINKEETKSQEERDNRSSQFNNHQPVNTGSSKPTQPTQGEGSRLNNQGEDDLGVSQSRTKVSKVDSSSAAAVNKTSKTKQHNFMNGERPPLPNLKMLYPQGDWLTESGYLNADFLRDRANLWRTGNTTVSEAFGRMPVEDVMAKVAGYYAKPENHVALQLDWHAYVTKSQRYLTNVQKRLQADIAIPPQEQQQIAAKLPAAMAKSESVFEAPQLPVFPNTNPQLPMLGSGTVTTVDVAAVVVNIPEGADSVQAYQPLQANEEDRTWMQQFSSVGVTKPEKPKPTSDEMARAREVIEQLKARKAEREAQKRQKWQGTEAELDF
jgi:hypothetical protein